MLNKFFTLSPEKLILYMQDLMGKGVTDKTNYLYIPNAKSPLLLQAHIDSYAKYESSINLTLKHSILTANGILGADDRAGCYGIWKIRTQCINTKVEVPNLLFTNFEESGGKGMDTFLKGVTKEDFGHIMLGVAIDRRGCNDYVYYVDIEDAVKHYVEAFGFIHTHGSYSDIKEWSEKTNIPSVNLSAGYYGNHTVTEKLHLDELAMTVKRVMQMIRNPIARLYPCKKRQYIPPVRVNRRGYPDSWEEENTSYVANIPEKPDECETCKCLVNTSTYRSGVHNIWVCDECRYFILLGTTNTHGMY